MFCIRFFQISSRLGAAFLCFILVLGLSGAELKRIALIGDEPDGHGAGNHEYQQGVRLLAQALNTSSNVKGIQAEAYATWPEDKILEQADAIVLYTTGANYGKHPLLKGERLKKIARLMEKGVGLVALHYTLYLDNQPGGGGPELLNWLGGYNDYQGNYSTHNVTDKNPPPATPASPGHPISRGWKEFVVTNEFYIKQRFLEGDKRLVPILTTFLPTDKPERQIVSWAVERKDGGRGFAFTDGHFHRNWQLEDYRKLVLNGICWTAKIEIPAEGVISTPPEVESVNLGEWKHLFNRKDLNGWNVVDFAGAGEIKIQDEKIQISTGVALTGIRKTNSLPTRDYEVSVTARKIQGNDFFCAITMPAGKSHFTFVTGGWGGSLVGISSIDAMDASENETTAHKKFEINQWYEFRVRVTEDKIQAWIDNEKYVDLNIKGRRVSMRPGEIEDNAPFGIATYQTTSEIKEVKIRSIPPRPKKILFLAGKKSHGPGEHEYEKSLNLLKQSLENSPDVLALDAELHQDGWPANEATLEDADTIVLFSDGSDHEIAAHPLLRKGRLQLLGQQMERGAGVVMIHYAVFAPADMAGGQYLDWLGGYFDYETGTGPNKWFSKIENRDFEAFPALDHPITSGVTPFKLKEEYYFNIRFPEDRENWKPIITFDPAKKDPTKVTGWAIERKNGGRGFGYTGGHYFKNFEDPNIRKLLLNAIIWTAHGTVPAKGINFPATFASPSNAR